MWHSRVPKIIQNYMLYSSAKEIWGDLNNTFWKKILLSDMTFKARCLIPNKVLSQSKYHETLNGLWIKLDQYQHLKITKTHAAPHVEVVERGRIFKFLHGLNHEYDLTKTEILGRENVSSSGSVKGKETRRVVMLNGETSNTICHDNNKRDHQGINHRRKTCSKKGNHGEKLCY